MRKLDIVCQMFVRLAFPASIPIYDFSMVMAVMIKGKHVGIRPLQSDDAWILFKWFNDPKVTEDLGVREPRPSISLEEEMEIVQDKIGKRSVRPFLIQDLDLDVPAGVGELTHIDVKNASAKVFVVVGETQLFTDAFFLESLGLVVDVAFRTMNLHRLEVRVPAYNDRLIRLYRYSGFEMEGRLRHDHFRHGAYVDSVILSKLRDAGGLN
jgi:RimJ/RimL family protein N-acetyltransferase